MARAKYRVCAQIFQCHDCKTMLAMRPTAFFGSGWNGDWFMLKNNVWNLSQRERPCRFLCVTCLEDRIGRKLSAADFRRSAKVNFEDGKSAKLRRRMRGLKPAKRLVATTFIP